MKKIVVNWTIIMLVLALTAASVWASFLNEPTPPNEEFSIINVSRRPTAGSVSTKAEAGNVTELNISATVVTRGWQGYYGNVSGTITLDDGLNNTMYSWALADPEGEVYASRNNSISEFNSIRST